MDTLGAFRRILPWTEARVAGTRIEQLHEPTPCTDWKVEDLLAHLFGTISYYTLLAQYGEVDTHSMRVPDFRGGSHAEEYRKAAEEALTAWSRPGVLERPCRHSIVGEVPGSYALSIHAGDDLIHGWDLARATGQNEVMDPASAQFALETFRVVLSSERSRRKHFDTDIDVGPEADIQTALLAFTGRDARASRNGLTLSEGTPTEER
jgi:uncharacterized protein (TIGR03086 family)